MSDYLTELNRVVDHLALMPDIILTALTGNGNDILALSDQPIKYIQSDDWAAPFEITLEPAKKKGALIERRATLAGVPVRFLFGEPSWALADPISAETSKMIAEGVFEIHDPGKLIEALNQRCGVHHADFADNSDIAQYGDVSNDFFRLVGLGEAVFISNESTLHEWCSGSGMPLERANARIREIYGVDVSDLEGGPLIGIFQRIRQGEFYRSWRASQKV